MIPWQSRRFSFFYIKSLAFVERSVVYQLFTFFFQRTKRNIEYCSYPHLSRYNYEKRCACWINFHNIRDAVHCSRLCRMYEPGSDRHPHGGTNHCCSGCKCNRSHIKTTFSFYRTSFSETRRTGLLHTGGRSIPALSVDVLFDAAVRI